MFDFKKSYKNIVVLTGAGISAESGIATFRDSNGLWENHRIEDVACPEGFERNPALVHKFYNDRRRQLLDDVVKPNKAHLALAAFEQRHKGGFVVITQNIDDLHERAGSKNVLHMHGELFKKRCAFCEKVSLVVNDISQSDVCDSCGEAGNLRPHIVWFGEAPLDLDKCYKLLSICDLFVAIGTSGHVAPASNFVFEAKGPTVEINMVKTVGAKYFTSGFYGNASNEVPLFFESINQ